MKKLRRSRTDRMIFGVCGGIGEFFNVDSVLIRVICIIFAFLSIGSFSLVYLLLAIVIPEEERPDRPDTIFRKFYSGPNDKKQKDIKEAEKVYKD